MLNKCLTCTDAGIPHQLRVSRKLEQQMAQPVGIARLDMPAAIVTVNQDGWGSGFRPDVEQRPSRGKDAVQLARDNGAATIVALGHQADISKGEAFG